MVSVEPSERIALSPMNTNSLLTTLESTTLLLNMIALPPVWLNTLSLTLMLEESSMKNAAPPGERSNTLHIKHYIKRNPHTGYKVPNNSNLYSNRLQATYLRPDIITSVVRIINSARLVAIILIINIVKEFKVS